MRPRPPVRAIGMRSRCLTPLVLAVVFTCSGFSGAAAAQPDGTLIVHVSSTLGPVAQADVRVGDVAALTNTDGDATLTLRSGVAEVVISRFGFDPARRRVTVAAGEPTRINVELEQEAVL